MATSTSRFKRDRDGGGGVVALRDTNGDGQFDMKETFGEGSSTGIALHNGYLYVAHTQSVERYKMTPGQLKPSGAAEVVVTDLPGEREHGDKGIAFDGKGSLYVNVGAPSNACQAKDRQAEVARPGSLPDSRKARRHLEVRREQAGPDAGRWRALRHRPAPDAGHHLARRRALHRDEQSRSARRAVARQIHGEGKCRASRRADVSRGAGIKFRLAVSVSTITGRRSFCSIPSTAAMAKTAGRCGEFTPPVAGVPGALGAGRRDVLHRQAISEEVSGRRVHRVPWLMESRADAAGRLQRDVPAVLRRQAVGRVRDLRQRICRHSLR